MSDNRMGGPAAQADAGAPAPALGRYRILSEIGRGAMGTVYRAVDPVLERTVAVKTLNRDLPEDLAAEMKARFVREARSAGRLNHPNIVTIYDADVAGEVAYIAMEYLHGQSLQQLMKSSGSLPFDKVADIVAQIAEGLDYAGRYGIVHRDIKPANIMVSAGGLAKITDFGLARVPSSAMTVAGTILGSPKYMSPEQVQEQPIDPRADIFSLGVVLYEMLVGRTPFEDSSGSLLALMKRIVNEPTPSAYEQKPALPKAVDGILGRALAKHPDERFQRAADFARALRKVAAPAASAEFAPELEPLAETRAASSSLGKLLADLQAFSRERAPEATGGELNLQLRKAFHYLEELARRVIQADPPTVVNLDLVYLGALPAAQLADGRVECIAQKLGEADVVDRLTLTYRMHSPRKARGVLNREEADLLKRQLEWAGLKFDSRQIPDEAGGKPSEAFLIEVDIAASATLRGDYEGQMVEITCMNVGVLGPAKYRLSAKEFDEAVWEFGDLLVGLPSRFAGLRLPDS